MHSMATESKKSSLPSLQTIPSKIRFLDGSDPSRRCSIQEIDLKTKAIKPPKITPKKTFSKDVFE